MQMNKFFIADNGHLIEVIEQVCVIKIRTAGGVISQPRTTFECRDRARASDRDRIRTAGNGGGDAAEVSQVSDRDN